MKTRPKLSTPFLRALDVNTSKGLLLYQSASNEVAVVDSVSGKTRFRQTLTNGAYLGGSLHPSGDWATIDAPTHVELVDIRNDRSAGVVLDRQGKPNDYFVTFSAFSADGRYLCVGGSSIDDGPCSCVVYRIGKTGAVVDPLASKIGHKDGIRGILFSEDSKIMVTFGEDREALVWDTSTWERRGSPMRHVGEVRKAAISPDGSRLMTCSDSRPGLTDSLSLWDLESAAPVCSRFSVGRNIASIGYLAERKTWCWMARAKVGSGLGTGEVFLTDLSDGDAAGLIDKAVSQMGFSVDSFGNLVPIDFTEQKEKHILGPASARIKLVGSADNAR